MSACFNSEGNFPSPMQKLKFSVVRLGTRSLFNDFNGNIFLLARRLNVEITNNLFNFTITRKVGSSALALIWLYPGVCRRS